MKVHTASEELQVVDKPGKLVAGEPQASRLVLSCTQHALLADQEFIDSPYRESVTLAYLACHLLQQAPSAPMLQLSGPLAAESADGASLPGSHAVRRIPGPHGCLIRA